MRESLESERDGNGAVFPCLGRVVLPIGRDPIVDELEHGAKTGVNELDHGAKMGLEARRRAWRREDGLGGAKTMNWIMARRRAWRREDGLRSARRLPTRGLSASSSPLQRRSRTIRSVSVATSTAA